MRFLLLAAGLLLSYFSQAQVSSSTNSTKFEDGSYVLADSRDVRHPGQLKLQNGSKLLIKDPDGSTAKVKPEQIYSFRIGQREYRTARDFRVQGGFGTSIDDAFVEKIDSGQVILMRYEYKTQAQAMVTMVYVPMSAYLLRHPADDSYVSVQPALYSTAGGNRFRDAVRPFLAGRADLLKILDDKRITMDNLPAVIHAVNTGKPYTLPLSHYEILKQQALAKQARKAAAADSARR